MISLDHIGTLGNMSVKSQGTDGKRSYLLSNHVNRVLDAAVRNDWDDGGISNAEVLDAVNTEARVNNTLLDVLRQACSTTRVCQ